VEIFKSNDDKKNMVLFQRNDDNKIMVLKKIMQWAFVNKTLKRTFLAENI
jgi:hypothetical protein